jgi:hypothetical protein
MLYLYNIKLKQNIMKAKRFQTTMIKTYQISNTKVQVSFDTLEEAIECVNNERELHPRSKKFNPMIWDSVEKKSIRA